MVVFSPVFDSSLPHKLDFSVDSMTSEFNNIKTWRKPNQIFIWFQWESPNFHGPDRDDLRPFDNFFNATMSYRHDSTFFMPYGSLIQNKIIKYYNSGFREGFYKMGIGEENLVKYSEMTDGILDGYVESIEKMEKEGKEKESSLGAIAIVSNCKALYRIKTLKYLAKLLKYPNGTLALDAYGSCGKHIQPRPVEDQDLGHPAGPAPLAHGFYSIPHLSRHYKFYFSFENSRCKDYITEKFFTNALLAGAVPIVAGADRPSYELLAPFDSFIHIDDFDSLDELVEHINYYIDPENFGEYYEKYFSWRTRTSSRSIHFTKLKDHQEKYGMCEICKIGHDIKNNLKDHAHSFPVIKDLHSWWFGNRNVSSDGILKTSESVCRVNNRNDLNLKRKKRGVDDDFRLSDLFY